jgi:hypothetical protein
MKRIIVSALAPLVLGACVGTDVGNPPATTEIGFEPEVEETRTATGALSLPNNFEIDEAWLVVDYVTLRNADDCSRAGDTDSVGPFFVNLAEGGEVYPEPPRLVSVSGGYCEIRIELAPATSIPAELEAPFAIRGKSILIRGTRPDGRNFAISSDRNERIIYEAEDDAIDIEPGANRLVSVFDTNGWIKLSAFEEVDDESIEVSPRNNTPLYQEFRRNFLNGSRIFRDQDRDGRLDMPERARAVGRPDFVD